MERIKGFFKSDFFKSFVSYVLILLFVVVLRVFFVDPVRVDGPSMDFTLANGEILILNKVAYIRHDIKRFDIVVVKHDNHLIVKRVIGLPGEVIEYRNNRLYIDGQMIDDPYPSSETNDFSIEDIGHTKIPGDSYFVMGDNRAVSLDSRSSSVGAVKKDLIVGKANFVIYPLNKFGIVK